MNGANGHFMDSYDGTNTTNGISKNTKLLWQHQSPKSTAMYKFLEHVNEKYHLQLSSFEDLHKWSIEEIGEFWGTCWDYLGVKAKSQPSEVRYSA